MALGLTVKPMLVTTPVVLLLLDLWPLGRVRLNLRDGLRKGPRLIAEKWPFWLLAAASAFMAVYAHAQGTSFGSVPLLDRIRTIPLNYAFYLLKTVWPQHLTVLYPGLLFHPLDILVALFYLLIPTLLVWQYRRYSLAPLIGWLWFLAVMLPTSGLIHFGVQSLADRFTYLPALGLSILVLPLFSIRRPLVRGVRLAVCTGILMGLALLTHRQLPVWRDTNHLFSHLLRFSPNHAFALANQAGHLRQEGRLQEAEDRMARACESPAHGDIHQIVYAEMMASQGKTQQARDQLLSINLLSPGSFSGLYHFTFAIVLNQLDDFPEAAREARLAADTLSPYDLIRHDLNLLGMVIAFRMGDPESALEWAHQLPHLQNRTQIGLDDLLPYYVGQWKRFQRIEAVDYFRDYLSRNPSQVEALNNLAWLMATSEWSPIPADEIVGYARRASAQGPSNPILLDTLGVALAHAGDFEAALEAAGQARDIVRAAGQEPSDLSKAIARHINAYQRQTPWLDDKAADRIGSSFYAP